MWQETIYILNKIINNMYLLLNNNNNTKPKMTQNNLLFYCICKKFENWIAV